MTHAIEELESICRQNGLRLSDTQVRKLESYVKLLLHANSHVNLISRKDEANVWSAHILHSLSLLFLVEMRDGTRILDLGTGGGLPGIPLQVALPKAAVTMVDSIRKKIIAVTGFINQLHLPKAAAICSRAEDIGRHHEYQRKFDIVVSRAVAPLEVLIAWSLPVLRRPPTGERSLEHVGRLRSDRDGCVIAFKGGDLSGELSNARRKWSHISIEAIPLDFKGIECTQLVGKKLVIARPGR